MNRYYFLMLLFFIAEVGLQLFFRALGWGVANRGVSFGFWEDFPLTLMFLLVFSFWAFSTAARKEIGWRLIVSGGAANLLARFILAGAVWDYLFLPRLGLWFNGADLLISTGVIVAIVEQFRRDHGRA